ncbi:MAG: hypothetical protein AB7L92_08190 [Alphaproteobacteria bacterium]
MNILENFSSGLLSVLKITGAPMLYRYPYRISGEGLRSDWQKIASDMYCVSDRMRPGANDEQ